MIVSTRKPSARPHVLRVRLSVVELGSRSGKPQRSFRQEMLGRDARSLRNEFEACALFDAARLWRSVPEPARGRFTFMALHVLPILKALAPLVANASGIVAAMRAGNAEQAKDRVAQLERETIRASEVLKGLAEQLQAIAQQLETQARQTERLQKRAQVALGVASAALALAVVAVIVALQN